MKKKRIFSLICVMCMLCTLCFGLTSVSAETYGKKATTGTYTYVGSRTMSWYMHQLYKHSADWQMFYPTKNLTDVIYHINNHGDDTLEFSRCIELATTKTVEWSTNSSTGSDMSIGMFDVFQMGVSSSSSYGYGDSYAQGYVFSTASTVTKNIKDEAPTGYYTRVPGYTFYKMQDTVTRIGETRNDTIYFDMPYGAPVVFTIYSKNNATWTIY